jgi:Chromo (CHRromatin Organisation MOdifier) domain
LFAVEELIALRRLGEKAQVQVKWLGFDNSEATWEPVSTIVADVLEMLKSFVNGQQIPWYTK